MPAFADPGALSTSTRRWPSSIATWLFCATNLGNGLLLGRPRHPESPSIQARRKTTPSRRFEMRPSALAIFLYIAGPLLAGHAQSIADPPKTFDLAAIDAYVESYVQEKGLVGLSVAIMRDGQIVLAKGYGQRSLETRQPVKPET